MDIYLFTSSPTKHYKYISLSAFLRTQLVQVTGNTEEALVGL